MTAGDPRAVELRVLNADRARFECVYPSCGGECCRNGRPGVAPGEAARIEANLAKFLPHLAPHARALVERRGFLTRRVKDGQRTLAVSRGWCVFFHEGCVLHKVGATEGDTFAYKPWHCAAFPLDRSRATGAWHVRQRGYRGEAWELFCLDPGESPKRALDTLAAEVEFASSIERGGEAWRGIGRPPAPPEPPAPQA